MTPGEQRIVSAPPGDLDNDDHRDEWVVCPECGSENWVGAYAWAEEQTAVWIDCDAEFGGERCDEPIYVERNRLLGPEQWVKDGH